MKETTTIRLEEDLSDGNYLAIEITGDKFEVYGPLRTAIKDFNSLKAIHAAMGRIIDRAEEILGKEKPL